METNPSHRRLFGTELISCLVALCTIGLASAPLIAAQTSWTPDTLPILVEIVQGPENILMSGFRLGLCVPSSFLTTDPQPILKNVGAAAGFCSDSPLFTAFSPDGILDFEADIAPPYDVTIRSGTDAEFFPDDLSPTQVSCHSFPPELLPQPPCDLVSVRIVEDASFWSISDASGALEFTTMGDAPVGRVPEPGFMTILSVGSMALVGVRVRHIRRHHA